MSLVKDENAMASNAVATGDESPDEDDRSSLPYRPVVAPGDGFFTIYKKGQGKWTRLGTVFAAGALAALTAYNLYSELLVPFIKNTNINLVISIVFLAVCGVLIFVFSNKPRNVDFLISTDSEMKKVNWTTKGELLGSTRVVFLFLLFIGLFLFVVDWFFAAFFRLIGVLQ